MRQVSILSCIINNKNLITADFGKLVGDKHKQTMKKLVITALAFCMGLVAANAQITTGESSAQVVRTGNRAEAGDFGLYLGGTSTMFKYLVYDQNDAITGTTTEGQLEALPLINFKYMLTDKFEARLGLEWWTISTATKSNGEGPTGTWLTKGKDRFTNKYLYPGVAYHFSNSNILDVYVGAELPIGWETTSVTYYADYTGNESDRDRKAKANDFNVGLGGFIGLQAYVANLPVAVGVEYGISSLKTLSSSKTITEEKQEYKPTQTTYNEWKVGQQVRLTLTYFFKM